MIYFFFCFIIIYFVIFSDSIGIPVSNSSYRGIQQIPTHLPFHHSHQFAQHNYFGRNNNTGGAAIMGGVDSDSELFHSETESTRGNNYYIYQLIQYKIFFFLLLLYSFLYI